MPKYVNTIGVVTSETGAVIRDIYRVTKSKNPYTNIIVYPARVQGFGAEKEIVKGIEYFNEAKNVDVIIVARGGGSFEDLFGFNDEKLARTGIHIIAARHRNHPALVLQRIFYTVCGKFTFDRFG